MGADAQQWFYRARRRADWRAFLASFRGDERRLYPLDEVDQSRVIATETFERIAVPLSRIKGTIGRSADFDIDFLPLTTTYMSRWVSVCTGMLSDPLLLPPVDLIQVGNLYYVDDGHHRVSVASILDHLAIDANVIAWQLADPQA